MLRIVVIASTLSLLCIATPLNQGERKSLKFDLARVSKDNTNSTSKHESRRLKLPTSSWIEQIYVH